MNVNTAFFVAKRILFDRENTPKYSSSVAKIAIISIALSVSVMVISIAVVRGFQKEIREKVTGFGSHIQINRLGNDHLFEDEPILISQPFYPALDTAQEVRHIQIYAKKPGIIETKEDIQGVIVKGIGEDFDWSFFSKHITQGKIFQIEKGKESNQIMISSYIASKLKVRENDFLTLYFVREEGMPLPRKFSISGIYKTGLEEFDQKFVLVDIGHIQKINKWGIQSQIYISENCKGDSLAISATIRGKEGLYQYLWENKRWNGKGPHKLCLSQDTTITLIVGNEFGAVPDTSLAIIQIDKKSKTENKRCYCMADLEVSYQNIEGSSNQYVGGFEVALSRYDDLLKMDDFIYSHLGYNLNTTTIMDQYPELFSWLELQDINVVVIITLMLFVACINILSMLFIFIIERTEMIGILKALGCSGSSILKIFLYNSFYIIGKGLFWGNLVGISLAFIQQKFNLIKLPQETYYVSSVPIQLDVTPLLLVNVLVIIIGFFTLLIPSLIILKMSPVKAIRFDLG